MSGLERKQEDEIGLWTIEKRVSFSVSGVSAAASEGERRGSSVEMERRDMKGDVGVEVMERRADGGGSGSGSDDSHGDLGKGKVTTVIDGGHNNRDRSTSRIRSTSRNDHRSSGM